MWQGTWVGSWSGAWEGDGAGGGPAVLQAALQVDGSGSAVLQALRGRLAQLLGIGHGDMQAQAVRRIRAAWQGDGSALAAWEPHSEVRRGLEADGWGAAAIGPYLRPPQREVSRLSSAIATVVMLDSEI